MAITKNKISGGVVHELSTDLRKALTSDEVALAAWEDITPLARNEMNLLDREGKTAEDQG